LAGLFEVRLFSAGEVIFRQGEPGDAMYIVLWGHVQIWAHEKTRQEKRADAERIRKAEIENALRKELAKSGRSAAAEKTEEVKEQKEVRAVRKEKLLKEYKGGTDKFPWFGEVFQWVTDHGRAGDALCHTETLTLMLSKAQVETFVRLAPGFKALSKSAATGFTIKSLKHEQLMQKLEEEKRSREVPLRYAFVWAKFVGKLTGAGGWGVAIADKMEAARKRREHEMSIEWVKDLSAQEDPPVSAPSSSAPAGTAVLDVVSAAMSGGRPGGDRRSRESKSKLKWVRAGDTVADSLSELKQRAHERAQELSKAADAKMMEAASKPKSFGDTRTLASTAASRRWRDQMPAKQQVRAEMLRQYAVDNPMGEAARKVKGWKSPNAWLWRDHSEGKALPPDLAQAAENNIGALRRGTSVGLVAEFD